jgi:hypothetical protein
MDDCMSLPNGAGTNAGAGAAGDPGPSETRRKIAKLETAQLRVLLQVDVLLQTNHGSVCHR